VSARPSRRGGRSSHPHRRQGCRVRWGDALRRRHLVRVVVCRRPRRRRLFRGPTIRHPPCPPRLVRSRAGRSAPQRHRRCGVRHVVGRVARAFAARCDHAGATERAWWSCAHPRL